MDALKGIIVRQPVPARAARGARIQAMCQDRRFATRTQVGFAKIYTVCVRGSPMVPLVGYICTIGTYLTTNGTIGKELVQMVKMVMPLVPFNQWYHWENSEHTHCMPVYRTYVYTSLQII